MSDNYLWLKALHVTFMVSWFAGLIYLPRLFTYHARADDAPGRERFQAMEMRLFVVMTIGAALAVYHYRCYRWIVKLRDEAGPRDTGWLRWFSEIPAAFLLAIVLLAVAKPF